MWGHEADDATDRALNGEDNSSCGQWAPANKAAKLGFTPNAYCNVAGVVAGGPERQRILQLAGTFVSNTHTLTLDNRGLQLIADPKNPYDKFAIKVMLATSIDHAGKLAGLSEAGFIPRAACPTCWASWGGKHADAKNCIKCGTQMPPIKFNEFLCQALAGGRPVQAAVEWISSGAKGSYGCRLALRIV